MKPPRRGELLGRQGVVDDMSRSRSMRALGAAGVALGAVALGAVAAPCVSASAWAQLRRPKAHAARVLNVRDEGRLRYVKSSGNRIIDEGHASGTSRARSRSGSPTTANRPSARASRSPGSGGSISARGTATAEQPHQPRAELPRRDDDHRRQWALRPRPRRRRAVRRLLPAQLRAHRPGNRQAPVLSRLRAETLATSAPHTARSWRRAGACRPALARPQPRG